MIKFDFQNILERIEYKEELPINEKPYLDKKMPKKEIF